MALRMPLGPVYSILEADAYLSFTPGSYLLAS